MIKNHCSYSLDRSSGFFVIELSVFTKKGYKIQDDWQSYYIY